MRGELRRDRERLTPVCQTGKSVFQNCSDVYFSRLKLRLFDFVPFGEKNKMLKYLTPHVASCQLTAVCVITTQPSSAQSHAHNFMEFSANLETCVQVIFVFLIAATQV